MVNESIFCSELLFFCKATTEQTLDCVCACVDVLEYLKYNNMTSLGFEPLHW